MLAPFSVVSALSASPGNHYPAGCLRQYDVNIGYYAEQTVSATALRVAPDVSAKTITLMVKGANFGAQSVVNPALIADPGRGAEINGFVWGYSKRGGRSGWAAADDLRSANWAADGPNHEDFSAGPLSFPAGHVEPRFTLGRARRGFAVVTASTAYLRWAPKAAARSILLRDEVVRKLWAASGYTCVAVGGLRGWVESATLK